MNRLLLLLVPATLFAGQARYARLGEFEGKVEVQLHAGDPWSAAERNLPLVESAWLRTGAASRLEIELDEGSAWRLGPDSQVEISDYVRLSTGQRVTVLSLDHGVAYFTGEPGGTDTLTLVVPGAQVMLQRGARVRLQADATVSRISVIEGKIRLSCPVAEIDVREGQTVSVEPANTARFALEREVPAMELDRWNEERDKTLASPASAIHVAQRYGLVDLDGAGTWVETDLGAVWKPKVADGWAPFQSGRWRWYDALGYTWVSDEVWGWVPYHHGRWARKGDLGWVWVPATTPVFKPGDVYWLHNTKLAGWGPLAPGEVWQTSDAPEQFLNVNTTYASFHQDTRVIDPAGFQSRPKDPLGVALFALALPSPPMLASRLEAVRPMLRAGAARLQTVVPGTTFQDGIDAPPPAPPAVVTNPASDAPPIVTPGPPPDAGPPMDPGPPGPPMQVIYPVPNYTSIVVINPPEHPDYSRRNPNWPGSNPQPAKTTPTTTTPATASTSTGGTTSTTTTTTAPRGPRPLQPDIPRAPHPPGERPEPVPVPISREQPRFPKPEVRPENKPEPRPAPAAEREQRPAPRPESRPVNRPEVKPAPKVDVKPDAKPDTAQVKK
jgi:hypothetical protein